MEFEEFTRLVVALFARYPSAQMHEATIGVWWQDLRTYPRGALIEAFRMAPRGNSQFCPSCEVVREHAAAWRPPTPRADLSRPALPESEPEIPTELREQFAEINRNVRDGAMDASQAGAAYLRAIADRL